jgi:ankyrin repeat protein
MKTTRAQKSLSATLSVTAILLIVSVSPRGLIHAQTDDRSMPALVDLVQQRQWEPAGALIDTGELDDKQLDQAQGDGMTALHWAAFHGDVKILEKLLTLEVDPNTPTEYGTRPLLLASEYASLGAVDCLLKAGADVDGRGGAKETALMLASRRGDMQIVQRLIQSEASIDLRERNGNTALMWAAAAGHAKVIEKLIDAGAEVNLKLKSDFTAFLFSVREGHIAAAEVFLDNGVDVNAIMHPENSNGRNPRDGMSALMLAVESGHFRLAMNLVKHGADPNDQRSGYAPLHALTWVRKADKGDNVQGDPEPRGSGDLTSIDFVSELVEAGADVNLQLEKGKAPGWCKLNTKGLTPLLLASRTADIELMNLLLKLGADPKLTNADGCTTMMAAAGVGVVAVGEEAGTEQEVDRAIEILADLGVDPNVVDKNGETAVHGAAYRNYPSAVTTLAKVGADPAVWNKKNKRGWKPHDIASGKRPGSFKPSPPTARALDAAMNMNMNVKD